MKDSTLRRLGLATNEDLVDDPAKWRRLQRFWRLAIALWIVLGTAALVVTAWSVVAVSVAGIVLSVWQLRASREHG